MYPWSMVILTHTQTTTVSHIYSARAGANPDLSNRVMSSYLLLFR